MDKKTEDLKVLRVRMSSHLTAKVNAAKKGIKLQEYMEALINADENGKVTWEKDE